MAVVRALSFLPLIIAVSAAPALAQGSAKDSAESDEAARLKVASELERLADFCAKENAPEKARAELELAILAAEGAPPAPAVSLRERAEGLGSKLEDLRARTGAPAADFSARYAEEQRKAYETCTKALLELAPFLEKDQGRYAACLDLLDRFPGTEVANRLGAAWFEPYSLWLKAADARKLETGSELVDGKWLDKVAVAALDRSHATWKDPWVLSDGVHEVRTTLPLRTGKQLLAYVGTYRRFLLSRMAGLWKLEPPGGGPLPVIVTSTQTEHRARWDAEPRTKGVPLNGGAACYLVSGDALNPCFVTFEPVLGEGRIAKVPLEVVLSALSHELTHQIVFEFTKSGRQERDSGTNAWCVEGLAAFMQQWKLERGRFRLERVARNVSLGAGRMTTLDPAFAWCKEHEYSLPPLAKFLALPKEKFYKVENYYIAGTLAWFLLEGEKGKYRKPFARLLDLVHKSADDEKSFATCFAGVDPKELQAEFSRFVAGL